MSDDVTELAREIARKLEEQIRSAQRAGLYKLASSLQLALSEAEYLSDAASKSN